MARSAVNVGSCGTLSSRTMIVIRMAITPSLNASRRSVFMAEVCASNRLNGRVQNAADVVRHLSPHPPTLERRGRAATQGAHRRQSRASSGMDALGDERAV